MRFCLGESRPRCLRCDSDNGLIYSLDTNGFEMLCKHNPRAARMVHIFLARDLRLRLECAQNKSGIGLM